MTGSEIRLAILGHPIGHSLSPLLHQTALKRAGINGTYQALDVLPGTLEGTVRRLVDEGYTGWNVTLPHKTDTMRLVDTVDGSAESVGAVNTVLVSEGRTAGYNTDVDGVLSSLTPFVKDLRDSSWLVIGAGGGARAVCAAARNLGAGNVVIASRTSGRGADLLKSLALPGREVTFAEASRAAKDAFLIVNTTPVGMHPHIDESPLAPGTLTSRHVVLDMVYRPRITRFLRNAARDGARTIEGIEILLFQAAKAFKIWTGKDMDTGSVRRVIEAKLDEEGTHRG